MDGEEKPDIHRAEIGDCPTEVRNRQDGFRPVLRAELLTKEDSEEILLHLCGEKNPFDMLRMIEYLSIEVQQVLQEWAGKDDGPVSP